MSALAHAIATATAGVGAWPTATLEIESREQRVETESREQRVEPPTAAHPQGGACLGNPYRTSSVVKRPTQVQQVTTDRERANRWPA